MMSQIRERCIRTGWLLVLTKEPEVIEKSRFQNIKRELVALSLPAFAGQGPAQLASAGVSISIFNIVSKLFNIPLLSVATSFVAEDIANNSINSSSQEENSKEANGNGKAFVDTAERKQLASVSTALILAVGIGISEGLALYFGSRVFLNLMGISSVKGTSIEMTNGMIGVKKERHTSNFTKEVGFTPSSSISNNSCDANTSRSHNSCG